MSRQVGYYLYDDRTVNSGDFEVLLLRTTNLLNNEVTLTAKILKYSGSKKDVVIPKDIEGYRTTEIAENAFKGNPYIFRIRMPNTINYIGSEAFWGCSNLVKVWMIEVFSNHSQAQMWIGDNVFRDCENLGEIIFPNKIVYTYAGCGYQFYNCKNLRRLDAAIIYVREHTFSGCNSLHKIYIAPDGFLEYKSLNNVPSLECVQFLGNINMDYMSKRVLRQIAKLSIVCPANSNIADLIYTGANVQAI